MHAEIQRADLARVLTSIARIVESRNTIPILGNVVLTLAGGTLTARGTDLDIEIIGTIAATGEDGTACVPARNLADIVKRLVGDTVSLTLEPGVVPDTGNLIVKSGRSRFKLPSIPSRSMPTLATDKLTHRFEADLATLFAPVAFAAAAKDERRHYLESVVIHDKGGKLRAVATDGARLALYDAELPAGAEGLPVTMVPVKVVGLIQSMKGNLAITVGPDRIEIAAGDTVMRAKLIEGIYPDYERVIPTANARVAGFDVATLAGAAGRVGLVASEIAGKALRLDLAAGGLKITANDKDGRDAADEIEVEYESEPTYLAFNCRFLDEMLAAIPGERGEFRLTDNTVPTLVKSVSDPAFVGVLTPFRM